MDKIPIMGIPILNRGDMLLRLFNSIDYPIEKVHIIANKTTPNLDNSVKTAIDTLRTFSNPLVENIEIYEPPEPLINLGVAGSWNKIILSNPQTPYWMLVGNDIQFEPGSLKALHELTLECLKTHCLITTTKAYSCFTLTPLSIQLVGTFDENIYPAYLEDCDYNYRLRLMNGLRIDSEISVIHGEEPHWSSTTINSNSEYRERNNFTHNQNFIYYRSKWGGDNGKETFLYPFNNSENKINEWKDQYHRWAW